ncbi:dTDP-4-dehydrorhamnose 3,5-epimerase [bacterium]|nr:dTDP-4-dehydrorhamnose 3,5-epimerase [bacterium]
MKITETFLKGLFVIEPKVFGDSRGFFMETFNANEFEKHGLCTHWVQDNHSLSQKGVVRGLHFQNPNPQIKLVRVTRGAVLDVAVDIRPESPTFGKHFSIELNEENKTWLYVPGGFAHGFSVLEDNTDFLYKCSEFYSPKDEGGILWNDPALEIDWKVESAVISDKDKKHPTLAEYKKSL